MESIYELVRKAETNYLTGTTKLGKYVNWSMHDTIERTDAYLNSQHISGPTDSLQREKPFFNISTAAANVWFRATDIDRKDIRFIPKTSGSVVLAFVANVMLQNWMDENRFGVFLNQWGRTLARYGSAVSEFVEKDGKLVASVIPWNRVITDPVDFSALPVIKKLYLTPSQLRKMPYDQDAVNDLISAVQARKTLDKNVQDNSNDFIEVYEVHGELESEHLKDDPDYSISPQNAKYVQQFHAISFVEQEAGEYKDFCLYKGREGKNPYQKDDLISEDGRNLAIGAVEHLFDSQWMVNHTAKNMKDTLDLASKLIFQTADKNYANRNVLSAIETGDILVHEDGKPLTQVNNTKADITALQNYGTMWHSLAQEITGTPDVTRGITQAQPLTYGLGQILNNNANSLFEIMTENKGLALEEMIRSYVTPHLRKKLKNRKQVLAILDDAGIQEIDSIYVPSEAIRRFNNRTLDMMEAALQNPDAPLPEPFNPQQEQMGVQQELGTLGNKRFFIPSEATDADWDKVFSDFEWDSIRVEVTNENTDKQAVLQTLTTVLQSIAVNPAILQNPDARMVFSQILNETGKLSPIQLSTAKSQSLQMPSTLQPEGGGEEVLAVNQ